jgi:hypothetical protein
MKELVEDKGGRMKAETSKAGKTFILPLGLVR